MFRVIVVLSCLFASCAMQAHAAVPQYPATQITTQQWQAMLDAVRATPEVNCRDLDANHVYCRLRAQYTDWFFTTPANPAHPAVIFRKSTLGPQGFDTTVAGHYAGVKRSYDRWYREFEAFNRREEEQLATQFEEARKYQPSDSEKQAVESVMYDLWAAREMGQFDRTYNHLAASLRLDVSRDEWNRKGTEFRQLSGPVKWRKMTNVRWYRELPGTALPGVYAEVSVEGAFENIPAYRAHLVFLQANDGTFRLVKEDEKYGDALAASTTGAGTGATAGAAGQASPPSVPATSRAAATPARAQPTGPSSTTPGSKAKLGIPTDGGGKISEARFKEYLAAVRALPDAKCTRDNFRQLLCDSRARATEWVFTVAGHTAHPAVVQRKQVTKGATLKTEKVGHFAGSREEFDIWFGTFEELVE